MDELFEKSLRTLELPRVLEKLAAQATSEAAKAKARALLPQTDVEDVKRLQQETSAACMLLGLQGSPSFAGAKDVSAALGRAQRGGMLNTRELLDIAALLRCARRVKDYRGDESDRDTVLDTMFRALHGGRFLEDRITRAIPEENEIADNASAELADIRRHMHAAGARSRQILQKIISSPTYSKALQESLITQRDGRFVVPVKAECRSEVPGLVHDVSSSGATVFVEPMGVVQANNELKELEAKEKKEIERILLLLSQEAAALQEDILWDYDLLVQLDLIFARGQLSYQMGGTCPDIGTDGHIFLRRARHPLLDKDKAVPIDVELGGDFDTLVITGPNTGGKTVTLKTIGLLAAMAQCGLHIPADSGSCVSVFDHVMADIGDEQSIEQSLSTFSSHMVTIVKILEQAGEGTLILFDELGAGTDPVEGAALAIAIIGEARDRGAKIAATTHYAELKTFAMTTPGVQNASCEFDVETLRPTYRLLIGIPGKSNAFAISQRLGLSRSVIERAKAQMDSESVRFEDVLTQLEQQRQRMEQDRDETARLRLSAQTDANKAREFRDQMERARQNVRGKAEKEARRILEDARAQAGRVFDELDRMRAAAEQERSAQQENEARAALLRDLNAAADKLQGDAALPDAPRRKNERPIAVGDRVELPGVKTHATVLSINKDGSLQLQAGVLKINARPGEVFLVEGESRGSQKAAAPRKGKGSVSVPACAAASMELDIRGMMTDEAEIVVDRFLDEAVMGRLTQVTIIHGKGTGALRKAVHQLLKRHPYVKAFRLGVFGEGEDGVTVAALK